MKRFAIALLFFVLTVTVALFFTQRAQADVPRSPSLDKIVYSSGYTTANQMYNIYVMNSDGTGQMQLTNQTGAQYLKPTWSPNGSKIAFSNYTDNQIYVMNADGSAMHALVNVSGHHYHPTWSLCGTQIAFSSDLYNPGATTPNHIYVVNADGSGSPVNLTSSTTARKLRTCPRPA